MEQIYSYLEGNRIDVIPVIDENILLDEPLLLDDDDDIESDDVFIKDAEDIDLDAIDLLEGIGTEDPVRMYLKEIGTGFRCLAQRKNSAWQSGKPRVMNMQRNV